MKTETEKNNFEIESNLKILAKSSLVVFIGLFLSKVLTYFYRIIIARNFGPEIYGVFSLATIILGWFVLCASFGLSEGLIRYVAWYRGKGEINKINYLIKWSLFITTLSGIFSGLLLFVFSEYISLTLFHNTELVFFLKIFSIATPFFLLANIFLSLLQAFEKISWYSFIINIVSNSLRVLFIVILIFLGLNSNAIVFSYILSIFGIFFVSWIASKKLGHYSSKYFLNKVEKEELRNSFFSYSWPLFFTTAVAEIFVWTDSFFIGYFNGVESVGFYNAAVPISLFLMIVPEIFLKLFFPLITKEFAKGKIEVIKQLSQQMGKWIFTLNLPIFVIFFFFPGVIINILFGSEYLVSSNALRILSFGVFLSSLVWVNNNLLSMIGKSKLLFYNLLGTSILNIILNIILIPKFYLTGAALATLVSKIVLGSLLFFEVKKNLGFIPLRKKIFRISLVSLFSIGSLFLLKEIVTPDKVGLVLTGIFFLLLYTASVFITNCFDKNDWIILKAIKRKIFN